MCLSVAMVVLSTDVMQDRNKHIWLDAYFVLPVFFLQVLCDKYPSHIPWVIWVILWAQKANDEWEEEGGTDDRTAQYKQRKGTMK